MRIGLEAVCEPYRGVLSKLVELLMERFGDRLISVVLFGSVTRCDAKSDSDVDLLIVAEGLPGSRLRRQYLFMEVEDLLQRDLEELESKGFRIDFSPIMKTPEEASRISPLYLDMVYDAVILFDRGGFFTSILEKLKKRLDELGAERVFIGRRWYWKLKKDYRFGEVIEIE